MESFSFWSFPWGNESKSPWISLPSYLAAKGHVVIWVIEYRLTKSAHFLAIRESSSDEKLDDVYVHEIVARHGVSVFIASDRDVRFTSRFWQKFHEELGTRLHFSTAYHP